LNKKVGKRLKTVEKGCGVLGDGWKWLEKVEKAVVF
jgi:hypothetical protein